METASSCPIIQGKPSKAPQVYLQEFHMADFPRQHEKALTDSPTQGVAGEKSPCSALGLSFAHSVGGIPFSAAVVA